MKVELKKIALLLIVIIIVFAVYSWFHVAGKEIVGVQAITPDCSVTIGVGSQENEKEQEHILDAEGVYMLQNLILTSSFTRCLSSIATYPIGTEHYTFVIDWNNQKDFLIVHSVGNEYISIADQFGGRNLKINNPDWERILKSIIAFSEPKSVSNIPDIPTIPEDVPVGIEHLYDFKFSDRYDSRIDGDFSITFSNEPELFDNTLFLYEIYKNKAEKQKENVYDGEGMVPHMYKSHQYDLEKGSLIIDTHYYKPDNVEYISYLWADNENIKTNRNIGVGSTEKELLSAYTEHLYYLDKNEAIFGIGGLYFIYDEGNKEALDGKYVFDYAYMWQPFTPETNEIRDITFYMKDDAIAAIEIIEPYELRHVYGYDREAGLQYTEDKRGEIL